MLVLHPFASVCGIKHTGGIRLVSVPCIHFSSTPPRRQPNRSRPSIKAAAAAAVEDPEIETVQEIENNVENQSTDTLYAKFDSLLDQTMRDYRLGDRVTGLVASVDDKGAFVDVGGKSPAWLPVNEVSNMKVDSVSRVVQSNTEREFQVVYRNKNPKPGRHEIVVSLKELEKELVYKRLQQIADEKLTVAGTITGNNAGGVFVSAEGIQGFCPTSHIPQNKKEEGVQELVGEKMQFHILEVDLEQERFVLSAKNQPLVGTQMQDTYKVGDVVLGTVSSVQPYGAFLEIAENVNGLLHVSQISHDHVNTVSDVLSVGDKLKVMVLTHDNEKGRLSLSTRKLEPTPGDMLKDPAKVFEKAEEMAEEFKRRVAEAEAEYGQAEAAAAT